MEWVKKTLSQTSFVCDDTSCFKDVFTGKQDKILIKKKKLCSGIFLQNKNRLWFILLGKLLASGDEA